MDIKGLLAALLLSLILQGQQSDVPPAYQREGDRVEQEFRAHRLRLDEFSQSLKTIISQDRPAYVQLRPQLQEVAPPPAVAGYRVLPRIVPASSPDASSKPVTSFSYSWPITASYIDAEKTRLGYAEDDLKRILKITDPPAGAVAKLVRDYREMANNQRTIDSYIQYNRFWQGSIAIDRKRFDELTKVYDLMKDGDSDTSSAIRAVLGTPNVPPFVQKRVEADRVVIAVPVYTDIDDELFLARTKDAIEEMWRAQDSSTRYAVEIEFRSVPASRLYPNEEPPQRRLDIRTHTAKFPLDGAVLTTGAASLHSLVGRYIALGAGDVSTRTLAHEFGHVLGFKDGYVRGYRDLGDQGFEILELTSFFDDLMSAPRQGSVQVEHFKLILDAIKK